MLSDKASPLHYFQGNLHLSLTSGGCTAGIIGAMHDLQQGFKVLLMYCNSSPYHVTHDVTADLQGLFHIGA